MKGATFLLPAVLKTVILPPLLIRLLTHFLAVPLVLRSVIYLAAWPLLFILRSHYSLWRTSRHARRMAAHAVPRVKGKWPLNLDVLRDWAKSGSGDEVGRMMAVLGRVYGGTYNTRVLGEDQVSELKEERRCYLADEQIITTDPRVIRHVLVDDFDNFVKGAKFRERAQGFLGDGIFNADGDR